MTEPKGFWQRHNYAVLAFLLAIVSMGSDCNSRAPKIPKAPREERPNPPRPDSPLYLAQLYETDKEPIIQDGKIIYSGIIDPAKVAKWQQIQWNLSEYDAKTNLAGINMPWAWSISRGKSNILIGVADSEINLLLDSDLALAKQCKDRYLEVIDPQGQSVTPSAKAGHGTVVLKVMSRCVIPASTLASVDWYSTVIPIQFKPLKEGWSWQDFADSFANFSKDHKEGTPAAINYSIAIFPRENTDGEEIFSMVPDVSKSIRAHNSKGSVIVAASGNNAKRLTKDIPAGHPGVIAVGAVSQNGDSSGFSTYGPWVAVMAPGEEVALEEGYETDIKTGKWHAKHTTPSGTSFASPHVTAVIALMRAVYPSDPGESFGWKVAEHLLKKNARKMTCKQYCSADYDAAKKESGARKNCQDLCCKKSAAGDILQDEPNICTAGLIDAYESVYEAQKGLPNVPLTDASVYQLQVFNFARRSRFEVMNVGGKAGTFTIESSRPELLEITPSTVNVDYLDSEPVQIRLKQSVPGPTWARLTIKTQPYVEDDPRHDSVRVYVYIQ